MSGKSTRDEIVEKADDLFYSQGFETTSFADFAKEVGISRGNFYHHFKTKDAILDAVIDRRIAQTEAMLERWEAEGDDPAERIRGFITILIANRSKIMLHGCPVGTLCGELVKLDHQAKDRARDIFALFRDWLARQFSEWGHADADALAMHVLARSQGVAALASAFKDEAFIRREVDDLCAWLESVKPKKRGGKGR
ncbi:MAG: TetR/AcrR family transcriptional regulator [Hyphomicrobiaceae bacterium]